MGTTSWIIVQKLAYGERPAKSRGGLSTKWSVNATATSAELFEVRDAQL
jgi:hypothetical protein